MAIPNRFPSVSIRTAIPSGVSYGLSDLRGDVLGGITAGGITLPIAIGYGVLSGLGPVAGLYGAVAVGIFASLFGGTRGLVYGPNTAVTVTMSVVVAEYADSVAEAATIGILAGLIQIIFWPVGSGALCLVRPRLPDLRFFRRVRNSDHRQAELPGSREYDTAGQRGGKPY